MVLAFVGGEAGCTRGWAPDPLESGPWNGRFGRLRRTRDIRVRISLPRTRPFRAAPSPTLPRHDFTEYSSRSWGVGRSHEEAEGQLSHDVYVETSL
jgi:hypothetical protein